MDGVLEESIYNFHRIEKEKRHQRAKQRAFRELASLYPRVYKELLTKHKEQIDKEEESLYNGRHS